jgi:hypothetical protein
MRKQCHFWPGEHGLDAWDVDRLLDLSRGRPVEEVELGDIWEVDTVYWFGDREQPTVGKVVEHARLIEKVDLSYPIILGSDGRVMDGMHQVALALLEGRSTSSAVRLAEHPEPDYRDVAQRTSRTNHPPSADACHARERIRADLCALAASTRVALARCSVLRP